MKYGNGLAVHYLKRSVVSLLINGKVKRFYVRKVVSRKTNGHRTGKLLHDQFGRLYVLIVKLCNRTNGSKLFFRKKLERQTADGI